MQVAHTIRGILSLQLCDGRTWTCPSRRLISRMISVYSSSAPSQPCTLLAQAWCVSVIAHLALAEQGRPYRAKSSAHNGELYQQETPTRTSHKLTLSCPKPNRRQVKGGISFPKSSYVACP